MSETECGMVRDSSRAVGARYEKMAGEYLTKEGYTILEYNYRCRMGEIDIIAQEGEYLVFCEVKYRSGAEKGSPLEAVGTAKQRKIYLCALHYITVRGLSGRPCRFDVIGFQGDEIVLLRNAFSLGL